MTPDLLVIGLYFLLSLAAGWVGVLRAKDREAWLVAGRRLGPGLYLGTLSAVVLGGASTLGTIRLGYSYGIAGVWLCACLGTGIVVLSTLLAGPLMALKVCTVSQVFARRYHPAARLTSAVIMLIYDLMVAVTSVIAIATILQVMFGLSLTAAVLLGGGVVVLYATLGGMWSLTLTDIIQFVIMTVGIMLVLLPMSIHHSGGWTQFMTRLPASYYRLSAIGSDTIILWLLIYGLGILIGQDIWQRVFTARSPTVARYAGLGAGLYSVLYGVCGALIGMAGKLILPGLDNPDNAFAAISRVVLPAGLNGLVAAAALAALMSTASACLLASATVLLEDIWPTLRPARAVSLTGSRLITLLTGVIMLGLAMLVNDVLAALSIAYNLLVGGMLLPMIAALFWSRANSSGVVGGMLAGGLSTAGLMLHSGLQSVTPIYAGLLASALVTIGLGLLYPARSPPPVR